MNSSEQGFHTWMDSPIGRLFLIAQEQGLTAVYQITQSKEVAPFLSLSNQEHPHLECAQTQLQAYFAGHLHQFTVPLFVNHGTEFQRQVWQALTTIPYGQTWTYAQLADCIGRPKAVRAVGAANGRNPLGIIVPCHRVIASSGALQGYAGGLLNKQKLLHFEQKNSI